MTLLPRYAGLVCLVAMAVLLVQALQVGSRHLFLLTAATTTLVALTAVYVIGRRKRDPRLAITLLYGAGVVGAMAGFCYLSVAPSGAIRAGDLVVDWGFIDKRPFVFGYLAVGALAAFHVLVARLAAGGMAAPPAPSSSVSSPADWSRRLAGGVLIAVLTLGWFGVPALSGVGAVDEGSLARFFDAHAHVHLGAMEQIRLGAVPYLEAQTQYGPGNQVLMNAITDLLHYSNHGFLAANVLLNIVCVVAFFVVVQQFLGLGWALAGLLGWVLWWSPWTRIDFAGWAILTRWLAIPVLAIVLAWLLVGNRPSAWPRFGPLLAGIVWGAGGFFSQESLTGGLLVLGFSLAFFGPFSGRSLGALAGFGGIVALSAVATFVLLVGLFVGFPHFFEVLALANGRSSLVMAGFSNTVWSDDLGLSLGFRTEQGRLLTSLEFHGEIREFFETYGAAVLLVLGMVLLAGFLVRRWSEVGEGERALAWKFGAVTIGAFVLHIFALLRSDTSHLAGPSFLLPLFLLALPLFLWRCTVRGTLRTALLVVSLAVIGDAALARGQGVLDKIRQLGSLGTDSSRAVDVYRELWRARGQAPDLASRYSPIPRFQRAFIAHPQFEEVHELFDLLHRQLRGRRLELGFYKFDDLVAHPETFYFLGGFRSLSGITSFKNSIWLSSDRDAWIARVAAMQKGCVFFEPDTRGELFETWMRSTPLGSISRVPIVGKRPYGVLACKD